MNQPLLICDLDGTLVDSFPGIAAALRSACGTLGVMPAAPIDHRLVGPPLDDMLRAVSGTSDAPTLDQLRRAFVAAYDGGDCLLSSPFEGVDPMLALIRRRGYALALATNKRLGPTRCILEGLGWTDMFEFVETIDSRFGPNRKKATMLEDICRSTRCEPRNTFYLGDMEADVIAAKAAGTNFILAAWGGPAPSTDARANDARVVAMNPMKVVEFLDRHRGVEGSAD